MTALDGPRRPQDTLEDIRVLKLAEMYESAYERFVLEMAERFVHDEEVRAQLRRLVAPGDAHERRIAAELHRLNARVRPEDRDRIERAALLDVLEVERSARRFYLRHVEDVHDARVAELFRELAREEAEHVRIAEDALRLSDRRAGRVHIPPGRDAALRMLETSGATDEPSA